VGKGLPDQLVPAELVQILHVGDTAAVSSLDGGLAIDTLVTTAAVPIRSIPIQIPLQLLDGGIVAFKPAQRHLPCWPDRSALAKKLGLTLVAIVATFGS
jgi:hypothetical protein